MPPTGRQDATAFAPPSYKQQCGGRRQRHYDKDLAYDIITHLNLSSDIRDTGNELTEMLIGDAGIFCVTWVTQNYAFVPIAGGEELGM